SSLNSHLLRETSAFSVVDRFSRRVRFVPFTQLPTTFQTAECLFISMFRFWYPWGTIHTAMVNDKGPIRSLLSTLLMPWSLQSLDVPSIVQWMQRSEEVWEQTHQRTEAILQQQKRCTDKP
ncbi:hypothetical protein NFI96_032219, partial [Prochilodus magdalenae]